MHIPFELVPRSKGAEVVYGITPRGDAGKCEQFQAGSMSSHHYTSYISLIYGISTLDVPHNALSKSHIGIVKFKTQKCCVETQKNHELDTLGPKVLLPLLPLLPILALDSLLLLISSLLCSGTPRLVFFERRIVISKQFLSVISNMRYGTCTLQEVKNMNSQTVSRVLIVRDRADLFSHAAESTVLQSTSWMRVVSPSYLP